MDSNKSRRNQKLDNNFQQIFREIRKSERELHKAQEAKKRMPALKRSLRKGERVC